LSRRRSHGCSLAWESVRCAEGRAATESASTRDGVVSFPSPHASRRERVSRVRKRRESTLTGRKNVDLAVERHWPAMNREAAARRDAMNVRAESASIPRCEARTGSRAGSEAHCQRLRERLSCGAEQQVVGPRYVQSEDIEHLGHGKPTWK
jgi:hypothetical protein